MNLRDVTPEDCATHGLDFNLMTAMNLGSHVVEHEGSPLAVIGCMEVAAGVGEAWSKVLPVAHGNGLALTRTVKVLIKDIIATHHLHRIQAKVYADAPDAVAWIQTLGFELECTLEQGGADRRDLSVYRILCDPEYITEQ